MNVNEVFLTNEVANELDLNQAYVLRVAKELRNQDIIKSFEMREAGKRNYIFSQSAVNKLKKHFNLV